MVFIGIRQVSIKDNSSTVSNMVKDKSSSKTGIDTRESIKIISLVAREGMTGVMAVTTKGSLGMGTEKVKEFSMSLKAVFTKVICLTI